MDEIWQEIPSFPDYEVSDLGRIRTKHTGRIRSTSVNQQGHLKVCLYSDEGKFTRTVAQMVARAFLDAPKRQDYISVIHLNGDKSDCRAENLAWRPRHFALRYHSQFDSDIYKNSQTPIRNVRTGEKYPSIQAACEEHGLILMDVVIAMHNRTIVWPTMQEFEIIEM